jgi:hypothetical protein
MLLQFLQLIKHYPEGIEIPPLAAVSFASSTASRSNAKNSCALSIVSNAVGEVIAAPATKINWVPL